MYASPILIVAGMFFIVFRRHLAPITQGAFGRKIDPDERRKIERSWILVGFVSVAAAIGFAIADLT